MRGLKFFSTKYLLRLTVLATLLFSAVAAQAGYVVTDGMITHIFNTAGNGQVFGVLVTGGTGPCASATGHVILFRDNGAGSGDRGI
jgi:hypothetical protein